MSTPEDLRREADAAEAMAKLVSYGPDRLWLSEKAKALRHQADRQEQRGDRRPERDN